jgi:hypothetical protein
MMKRSTRNFVIVGAILVGILAGLFSNYLSYKAPSARRPPPPTRHPRSYPKNGLPHPLPPPTSIELVDESLRELDWGNIAFNAPARMRYAQQQAVELLLSPSLSVADLQAQLQQEVAKNPLKYTSRIEWKRN